MQGLWAGGYPNENTPYAFSTAVGLAGSTCDSIYREIANSLGAKDSRFHGGPCICSDTLGMADGRGRISHPLGALLEFESGF